MTFGRDDSLGLRAAVAATLGLSMAAATLSGLEREAHAAERAGGGDAATSTDWTPPIAWGLRLNAGAGAVPDGGIDGRAGLDAEYWVWRNVGIGMQFAVQMWGTFNLCGGDCSSADGRLLSIAPSVSLRGSNPANFPIVSLALGVSWGKEESLSWCDYDPSCPGTSSKHTEGWGPYAALTAAWLFHPGELRPGAGAFAIGPLLRVDGFSIIDPASTGPGLGARGWTLTTGMTFGFGLAGAAAR